jgi:hypothetical protein
MYPLAWTGDVIMENTSDGTADCMDSNVFIKSLVEGKVIICMVMSEFFEDSNVVDVINTIQKVGAAGVIITGRQLDIDFTPAIPTTVPSAVFVNHVDSQVGFK